EPAADEQLRHVGAEAEDRPHVGRGAGHPEPAGRLAGIRVYLAERLHTGLPQVPRPALDDVLLVQPAAAAPPGGRAPVAPRAGHRRRAAEPAARASAAHGEDGAAVEVDAELVV